MERRAKIYVAGHSGMVGSAVVRELTRGGFENIVTRELEELDLTDANAVASFYAQEKPQVVVMAAARVGGIAANIKHPAQFLHENLMIQANTIHQAHLHGVERFCFLGSSCIYPRECPQPMREEYLLTGPLEPTNEAYAIAKIAGLKAVEYYRREYGLDGVSVMPCNLYGTNDHFDENAHVLSSLVRRFVDAVDDAARQVPVWGTGSARREFMHVDDCARAIIFMLDRLGDAQHVNLGWGEDVSIRELAEMIGREVGYEGEIAWDTSKPDGMPRKCLDVNKMKEMGFEPTISLEDGIRSTVREYRQLKVDDLL